MKIRVYYEDTDEQGVVYHSNYLNYCERARSEIFFQKNVDIFSKEFYFVVKNLTADFKNSAKLGDIIEIKTRLIEIKRASLKLEQRVFRDDEEIFTLELLLVSMSKKTSFQASTQPFPHSMSCFPKAI